MITFIQVALSLLLLFGCFFILVGALGLVKLSTFFKRLHAPTKASTLGVGCVLAGSVLYHIFLGEDPQPRELLITVFLFITAPISAHMMAKAALSLMMEKRPTLPGHETAKEEQLPPPCPRLETEGRPSDERVATRRATIADERPSEERVATRPDPAAPKE